MHFESEFVLNRQHLEECYDQSLPFTKQKTPRYKFMALLVVCAGAILLFTTQQDILAYFLLALAILEWFSFRYRRAWWLTRQMWSRNSGNTIRLTIDDKGIKTTSLYNNSQLLWGDISKVEVTNKGLMLTLVNGGFNYLANENLDETVISFIKAQVN